VVDRDRGKETLRIWVASASYGEDLGLPAQMIFPHLVGTYLSGPGSDVEVLNSSRAGYSLSENLQIMQEGFPVWRPDVAVLYTMSNDVNQLSQLFINPNAPLPPPDPDPMVAGSGAKPQISVPVYVRLLESTKLYQGIKSKVTPRVAAERILADHFPAAAQDRFLGRLQTFVDICHSQNVKPVICTFAVNPQAFQGGSPAKQILLSRLRYNLYLSLAGWQDAIEGLNREIMEFGEDAGIAVIDVASIIEGRGDFRDFVHFEAEGHDLVARCIAGELSGILANETGSPR